MILPWTSSVNNNTINGSNKTYEDLMVAHVWNLYTNLTASGWQVVSASFYDADTDTYTVGTNWTGSSNIKFPLSMCSETQEQILLNRQKDLEDNKNIPYTPIPHSWATLRNSSFNDGNYFLTIDCRYPLPIHSSSTGIIIERADKSSPSTRISAIKSVHATSGKNEKKYFAGPSAIYKEIDFPAVDSDGRSGADIIPSAFLNKQDVNPFNGVTFQTDENLVYDSGKIQDYPSRTVAFIDIAFHKVENILSEDGSVYKSMTTAVRPKTGADDLDGWYVCWGFDFFDSDISTNIIANKNTILDNTSKYKYAFHHSNGNFIYQIYNNVDATFKSGVGFLPVYNSNTSDDVKNTSLCINCDPKKHYLNNCINFNTVGKNINLISGNDVTEFENNIKNYINNFDKEQLNNFYNTCFKNYNFSDGITSIKAGDAGYVGKIGNLPIFTPTKPEHSCILTEPQSFISSSFSSISGQQFYITDTTVTDNIHQGSDTDKIMLPNQFNVNSNINYFKNNKDKKTINPLLNNITTVQTFLCFTIDSNGFKRILFNNKGDGYYRPLISINNVANFDGTDNTQGVFFKESFVNINIPNDIDKSTFLNVFNNNMFIPITSDNTATSKYIIVKLNYSSTRYFNFVSAAFFGLTKATSPSALKVTNSNNIITNLLKINPGVSIVSNATNNHRIFSDYLFPNFTYTTTTKIDAVRGEGGSPTEVYALIDISSIYDISKAVPYNGFTVPQFGNFNYGHDNFSTFKKQEKGINYFSVFKSKEPLASSVFTFAKSTEELSDKSVFGMVNKIESETDNRYLVGKDAYNSYAELPTFLFSNSNTSGKLKGYVPDITLAPQGIVDDGTVIKDTTAPVGTVKYKKVFWGGMWFPWVSSEAPDLG